MCKWSIVKFPCFNADYRGREIEETSKYLDVRDIRNELI